MNAVNMSLDNSISKYVKQPREKTLFYRAAIFYVFSLYVMPQYFGIPNPFFDLTIVRISIIILLIFILFDFTRTKDFLKCLIQDKTFFILLPYIAVLGYTMVLRVDLNAFLNPFIEFLEMYLMIYVIKDCFGYKKTVKLCLAFTYLFVILGFIEIVMQRSPFSFLITIDGLYTGRFIRGGSYRIMGNQGHSIAYGLYLITALPMAGLDVDNNTYDILKRPFLLIGIIINIFATGSRSSIGMQFVVLAMMIILSDRQYQRRNILIITTFLLLFIASVIALQKTYIGNYILLQFAGVFDSFFETDFVAKLGGDAEHLGQSAAYRQLLKRVFRVSWLNPLLGIGRKRLFASEIDGYTISSIDNFYVAEYIRYAYPGMITFIVFLLYMLVRTAKDSWITKSATIRSIFIGTFCYIVHLYVVDSLQTFKYLYVLFAIYICCDKTPYIPEPKGRYFEKRESKYVKK